MTPFDQVIAGWHDFYVLLGTASATLVGLIFIAASLHVSALQPKDRQENGLFTLVYQSFSNFLNVLLISAVFLMPQPGPTGLSIALAVVALLGIAERGLQYRRGGAARLTQTRASRAVRSEEHRAFRLYIPLLSYLALLVIAFLLYGGSTDCLYWMVAILLALIVAGARTAFILLIWDETDPDAPSASL